MWAALPLPPAPRQRDEVGHTADRQVRCDHQNVVDPSDEADGRKAAHRVVRQLRIDAGVHGERADVAHEQGVPVGCGLGDLVRADGAAGPRPALDDHAAAQGFLKLLAEKSREYVRRAARRERNDQGEIAGRSGLGGGPGAEQRSGQC